MAMLLTVFFVIAVLVIILLVWFYQKNQNVRHPIVADVNFDQPNVQKSPIYLAISPKYAHQTDRLMAQFALYHPDYEMIVVNDNHDFDIVLGDAPKGAHATAFNYATIKQSNQPLTGYLLTDNESALVFRDFLLSSPAQDILIDENFDTIEPYRSLSHAYFDTKNTAITPQSP